MPYTLKELKDYTDYEPNQYYWKVTNKEFTLMDETNTFDKFNILQIMETMWNIKYNKHKNRNQIRQQKN